MPAAPSVTLSSFPAALFFLDPYQRWFARAAITTCRGGSALWLAPRTNQNAITGASPERCAAAGETVMTFTSILTHLDPAKATEAEAVTTTPLALAEAFSAHVTALIFPMDSALTAPTAADDATSLLEDRAAEAFAAAPPALQASRPQIAQTRHPAWRSGSVSPDGYCVRAKDHTPPAR